jgi:hypothetical protein
MRGEITGGESRIREFRPLPLFGVLKGARRA